MVVIAVEASLFSFKLIESKFIFKFNNLIDLILEVLYSLMNKQSVKGKLELIEIEKKKRKRARK